MLNSMRRLTTCWVTIPPDQVEGGSLTEAQRDRQTLEQYRESDGRLNLDRLVEDFRIGWRQLRREMVRTYRERYPRSTPFQFQPVLASPKPPLHHTPESS